MRSVLKELIMLSVCLVMGWQFVSLVTGQRVTVDQIAELIEDDRRFGFPPEDAGLQLQADIRAVERLGLYK